MNTLTNITISMPVITLNIIIWGIYAGLVIACAAAVRKRNLASAIVSRLLDAGADSPDTAVTLAEAGIGRGRIKSALRSLKSGTVLSRYVICADRDRFTSPLTGARAKLAKLFSLPTETEKLTPDARFFIPEENRITAEVRFKKKPTKWWVVLIFAAALAAVMVFISKAIPQLLSMLDDTVGYLGSL